MVPSRSSLSACCSHARLPEISKTGELNSLPGWMRQAARPVSARLLRSPNSVKWL
jgi:hypothetical protein